MATKTDPFSDPDLCPACGMSDSECMVLQDEEDRTCCDKCPSLGSTTNNVT